MANTDMKRKICYAPPAVLKTVSIHTEGEIMAGSVVDHADITSVGQKVTDYDFSEGNTQGFSHTWED